MKRPLVLFTISFSIGVAAAGISRSWFLPVCLCAFFIALLILLISYINRKLIYFIFALLFFNAGAFGFLVSDAHIRGRYVELQGEWVKIRGYIDSEPDIKADRVMYKVRPLTVTASSGVKRSGGLLLLVVYKNSEENVYDYGREVEFEGKFELPKGVRNPGSFDYSRYLTQEGVSALVYCRNYNVRAGESTGGNFIKKLGLGIRHKIISCINKSLPGEQAGLLNGMLIGAREGLTAGVQAAFSNAGLTHLMAVSGANVAFIAAPLVFLFKKLRIRRRVYNLMVMGILLLFLFITGFEPSVVRAVIMADMMLIGYIFLREPDVFTSLAASGLILLIGNPGTLFSMGFQLSFAATLSLILFGRNIKKILSFKFIPGFIADLLSVTLAAQLGVIPITLYSFNTFSPISLISNLAAVPAAGLVTVLGSLMALFGQVHVGLSQLIGYINYLPLSLILLTAKFSSAVPFSSLRIMTPSFILIIIYYTAIWFLFWYRQKKGIRLRTVHLVFPLALVLVLLVFRLALPGRLETVFLDVGEGDACFIKTASGTTVLIDGGGGGDEKAPGKPDAGESVIIPFLLDRGIGHIDVVFASHGHADHINGLKTVLGEYRVNRLVLPEGENRDEFASLLQIAGSKGIDTSYCRGGDIVRLDRKTEIKVLINGQEKIGDTVSLNNGSLVLKLKYGAVEVLLPGDLELSGEEKLLKLNGSLRADVLKVAHHGSKTSTSPKLLKCVRPKAAIISVGSNNFGHPSQSTLDRLEGAGARVFRTDMDGALVLTSNGKTFKIERTAVD